MANLSIHQTDNTQTKFQQREGYATFRISTEEIEIDFYVDDAYAPQFREALAMLLDEANNATVEVR